MGEICNSEKKKKFRENEKSDRDRRRMHLRGCRTSCSLPWDGKDGGLLSIDFRDIAMTPLQGIGVQGRNKGQNCSHRQSEKKVIHPVWL